jgi:hypothetical protein
MPEPTTASVLTYFSIAKIWSIVSGVCGSIIPILALADKTKITVTSALFMALTGSSFSIFVGPWLAERLSITTIEGIVALAWIMGASGVYLVRSVLKWLETRGVQAIDGVVNKTLGINAGQPSVLVDAPPESVGDKNGPTS